MGSAAARLLLQRGHKVRVMTRDPQRAKALEKLGAVGVLWVMSGVIRPFHPGLSQVMRSSIWFDTTDQTFDPRPTSRKYPISLTKLESWVENQVEGELGSMPAVAS